jgi:hypothetical protein
VKRATWCRAWKSSRRPSATAPRCSDRRAGWSASTRCRSPRRKRDRPRRGRDRHSPPAVDIVETHARPESFRYAAAIHQRGVALLAARRAAEALPDLTRAAATLQRTFPPGHAVTRWFQADLVLALARAGRNREAQDLAKTLVPASGPPSGRSAIKALYALGVAKRLAGDAFRRVPRTGRGVAMDRA